MFKTHYQKLKEKKIRETTDLISYSKMMIGYYTDVVIPAEEDDKKVAQHELKVMQLQDALKFNESFVQYMQTQ